MKHSARPRKPAQRRLAAPTPAELDRDRLVHELQVHQIELETQNRELREAQQLLEVSRDRYADLYDFAPCGYVALDEHGLIRELNLTAAGMLGVERARLLGTPFHLHVAREDAAVFREHLRQLTPAHDRAATELRLVCKRGGSLPVLLQSARVPESATAGHDCRTTITDLTARKHAEAALRDSEARLRAIVDSAVDGIITIDEHGVIESFNPAAEKLFGYSAAEITGRTISALMPSPHREAYDDYLAHYRKTGERRIIGIGREVEGRRKDGSVFPLDLSVSELQVGGRRLFTGIVRDITERKASDESLRRSRALLARAQEISHVGSYEVDVREGRVFHSPETCRILGVEPSGAELSPEASIVRHVHPDDAGRVRETFQRAVRENSGFDLEFRVVRPGGSLRWVRSIAEPLLGADHKTIRLVGTLKDTTERKELEHEILAISEREQRRFGRDLHDGLGQRLTALEFFAHNLAVDLQHAAPKLAKHAERVARELRAAVTEARQLAHGLSPVAVDAEGLMRALTELAAGVTAMAKVRCQFVCPAPVPVPGTHVATHLFRIAQEAVNNAVKYSGARRIRITLSRCDGRLKLSVDDHGKGLSSSAAPGDGMGMRVMKYRADLIGAALEISSSAKQGVRITCSLEEKS